MRKQEASRRVSNLLWNRYIVKRQLKNKTIDEIKNDLLNISDAISSLYFKCMLEENRYHEEEGYDIDDRSGHVTYGYEDLESIKNNLEHISDRFNCAFRLRWMIDLIQINEYSKIIPTKVQP